MKKNEYSTCDEWKCKNERAFFCCLCENNVCTSHAHFVDDMGTWKRYVCNSCYQTCMIAYENYQEMAEIALAEMDGETT